MYFAYFPGETDVKHILIRLVVLSHFFTCQQITAGVAYNELFFYNIQIEIVDLS
jgi:hypothetical protein